MSPARATQFVPGVILARRYRIVTRIGEGGMGEVYRAEDLRLGQTVALKFLSEELAHSPTAVARLHQEVRLARQVSHPNVCRVFDIGDAEGQPFLTMEYIGGEDLASLLRRIGRLPVDKGLAIAQQLCAGLAAIHDSGILHRDLKPANILIDGRGRARITDFGISALTEEAGGGRVGTPAYMAPEQLTGGALTVRTDLYSLGLILYETLTGCPALTEAKPRISGISGVRRATKPVPPSALVREIDPRLDLTLLRCLETDPAARPASALQLAAALPGVDPLAAAVAAGETPSPALVAASPKIGALRPAVAAGWLGLVVACILAVALLARDDRIVNPPRLDRPPEVMADRARSVLSRLGFPQAPRARAFWYAPIVQSVRYQTNLLRAGHLQEANDFGKNRFAARVFVYRESPFSLLPHGPVISGSDPPIREPGEILLWLDAAGSMRRLAVVPDERLASRPATTPDWRKVLAAAGLKEEELSAAEPQGIPSVPTDARAAWQSSAQVSPGKTLPLRIEAGAFRGAPVYFELGLEYPESSASNATRNRTEAKRARWLEGLYYFFYGTVALGGLLLARRSLRLGRGDVPWANRLAAGAFLLIIAQSLILVHGTGSGTETRFWLDSIGRALSQAALVWVCYMGLEPILRRRWPERVLSWSRLLGGGVRDPLVGRDILIGCAFGLGVLLVFNGRLLWSLLLWGGAQLQDPYEWTSSSSHVAQWMLDGLMGSLLMPLCFLVFLLSLRIALRQENAAALVLWLLLAIVLVLRRPDVGLGAWSWTVEAAASLLFVLAWKRFGLLAGAIQWLTFYWGQGYFLTADLSSWYAGRGLLSVGVPLALAVYGFVVSTAGQPWFRDEILDG